MGRIKLGILQVNHDKSAVGDAFPDDAHRFRDLFDRQEDRFTYRVYMTIGGELPADPVEQDAYVITGSPLSVLDRHLFSDDLAEFIRRCDAARVPLLGACFGHQAIALALGGKVERAASYNVGIEATTFTSRRPWMEPPRAELPMYVFHEDQVTALPEGCNLLGHAPGCAIASFAKGDHIFTTQAHPEFTAKFMSCVLEHTQPNLPPDTAEAAWASLKQEQDGNTFGTWATRFFKQGMRHGG